jgi:hypothetical protein
LQSGQQPAQFCIIWEHDPTTGLRSARLSNAIICDLKKRMSSSTNYSSSSPLFFGRRVIDVQSPKRRAAHDRLVQKIALTAIVGRADNST